MTFNVRCVAVAIATVLHAVSGVFLSVLALSLQRLFPSLKQLPPSFDHIPDLADPPGQHSSLRRDSGYSIHTATSDGVSSDESLLTPSPNLEADPKVSHNDHVAILLASQARARAARPSSFALSSSLWTLNEFPSPKTPQLSKERWATTMSNIPPNTSCNDSTVASDEHSEAPSNGLKRKRSSHYFALPFHRKRCRPMSPPHPGFSRCKSAALSPHLRELAKLPRNGSSSDDHYHRRISVSERVRKVVAPKCKGKGGKHKGNEKILPSESASRVGSGPDRTDPYRAPYFFPSPMSPWANDYSRLDRNLVLRADVPALSTTPVRAEDQRRPASSSPSEYVRSVWAPLRRRNGLSHSGNP